MPVDQWPRRDREAWRRVIEDGDIFDGAGLASRLAPASRLIYAKSYGRWLTFLMWSDRLDTAAAPRARVSRQAVADYLEELREQVAPVTVAGRISRLWKLMTWIEPEADWDWLHSIAGQLERQAIPSRSKRPKIRPARELYQLGFDLMESAKSEIGNRDLRPAILYRDGLMIALLAACPLRISNLESIRIGEHLIKCDGGYSLRFGASETKNRCPLDVPVPEELTARLDCYIENYRPVLLKKGRSEHLWISLRGKRLAQIGIYCRIIQHTKNAFGQAINPHLFRDCAATSIAIDDPDQVRIAARILGHASFSSTERYYNQATMISASRRYRATLRRIRQRLQKPSLKRGGPSGYVK